MKKIRLLLYALRGEWEKIKLKFRFCFNCLNIQPLASVKEDVIVSLTSYGDRVKRTLPYTLCSLLRQNRRPDKIIVWLDHDNWSDDNLPNKLKCLKNLGVTFAYCADLKSYKKLIPTLQLYPSARIITVDDDIYYPEKFVDDLVKASVREPQNVHAYTVRAVGFEDDDSLKPYEKWKHNINGKQNSVNCAIGCGGCIYLRQHFYDDILNEELFSSLAPTADDIWFFFMEFLAGTKVSVVRSHSPSLPLDAFFQKFHKGSSLADSNVGANKNDIQIKSIMDYYCIKPMSLKKSLSVKSTLNTD